MRARVAKKLERVDFSELAIVTPYGRIEGSGPVKELRGAPSFDLKGTFSPDWKALTERLARDVEPHASITGSPRAWRLAGTLPDGGGKDLLGSVNGEFGLNLEQVDVFGMRLGRTALVVRADGGKVTIDPIDSTLNSGRLHLEPEVTHDKQGLAWVHLGSTSGLLDAVVNDEVSHRVLSFVAPVLDQATRVRGRVSLALTDAFFPLGGGPEIQPKIDGDVLFDAVEFMPGPLADQLIGIFRQERRPLLVLRDPVSIRIVGRTIYQEGLIIPLGNVAAIGIDGTVDFDQNLNLVASFAVAPLRKEIPVLSEILANTQLQVPITGTLKNPRINGDAIAERLKNMGVNMLDTVIGAGVNGLGRILQGGPGAGRGGRPRDFFPPFVPPGAEDAPPLRSLEATTRDELETTRPGPIRTHRLPLRLGPATPTTSSISPRAARASSRPSNGKCSARSGKSAASRSGPNAGFAGACRRDAPPRAGPGKPRRSSRGGLAEHLLMGAEPEPRALARRTRAGCRRRPFGSRRRRAPVASSRR